MKKFKTLEKDLIRFKKNTVKAFEEAQLESMNSVIRESKVIVPVKSGKLRDSLKLERQSYLKYKFGSDLDYAKIVEFGDKNRKANLYITKASEKYTVYLNSELKKRIKY